MASAARFLGALAAVALIEVLLGELLPPRAHVVDLFVLLAAINALRGNSLQGLSGGLVAGFVQDILTASLLGIHAIACLAVGYTVARLSQRVLTSSHAVAGLLIAAGALLHQIVVFGLHAMFDIATFERQATTVLGRVAGTAAAGVVCRWSADRAAAWLLRRRTLRPRRVDWR